MSNVMSFEDKKEARKDQISLLVKTYYDKFDFLKFESLDTLTDKALSLFLDSDLSMDEINDKLIAAVMERKKIFDDRYDEGKVHKNHEEIYRRLEEVVRLLNEAGVDYQLAGALCGYLKYGEESDRCHDDLDFNVNEEDIDKLRGICTSMGLSFEDNRLNSPRVLKNGIPSGEHEVIARDLGSDFHIGVFPFQRLEDGTVISKGYYHDEDGDSCVREEIYLPDAASEIFGREEIEYNGIPVIITPPEYVYCLKNYTRNQKDIHDLEFMEERIDRDKLTRIETSLENGKVVQNVPVSSVPGRDIHNEFSSSNDDLNDMLSDYDSSMVVEKDESITKEKPKTMVKKNDNSSNNSSNSSSGENGFINNVIVSTLLLITFTICAIGLLATYLIVG